MADDPTTTGNGQPTPEQERQTATVTVPVGLMREKHPFRIEISGEIIYEVDLQHGELRVSVNSVGDHQEWIANVPLAWFTGASLMQFLSRLKQDFSEHLGHALLREANSHLSDIIGFLTNDMGMDTRARAEIIELHLTRTRHRLEHLLGALPAKTTGAWTKIKLEGAIRVAMFALLMRSAEVKAETVADEIRRLSPATGPASGGALKKQVSRFSINWRKLRRDVEGIAAAQRKGDIAGGAEVTKIDQQ